MSPPDGTNWMWLLLDTDQNPATGWSGSDFIVNRTVETDGTSWLERNIGGWNWKRIARVRLHQNGNELEFALPRKALSKTDTRKPWSLDFKWADNLRRPGEVLDFYLSGDVAPEGRFFYRYTATDGMGP